MENYSVNKISYEDTKPFILNIHYAKRMPSISYAYGLFLNNELVGIVSYGSPVSPSLCKGIAGLENKSFVIECDLDVVVARRKDIMDDKKHVKKVEAYKLITAKYSIDTIDTSVNSIREIIEKIVKK